MTSSVVVRLFINRLRSWLHTQPSLARRNLFPSPQRSRKILDRVRACASTPGTIRVPAHQLLFHASFRDVIVSLPLGTPRLPTTHQATNLPGLDSFRSRGATSYLCPRGTQNVRLSCSQIINFNTPCVCVCSLFFNEPSTENDSDADARMPSCVRGVFFFFIVRSAGLGVK